MDSRTTADVVVVGGGTLGAWCAWFLRRAGAGRVVLLERGRLGQGASSRAAGMVRAQGGTEAAVRLGIFTRDFYRSQQAVLGIDSGLVEQGYFMPAYTDEEVAIGTARVAMQRGLGPRGRVARRRRGRAPQPHAGPRACSSARRTARPTATSTRRPTCAPTPRRSSPRASTSRERTAFTGLRTSGGRVVGVDTSAGPIDAPRVVLTGGPTLGEVGDLAGFRVPAAAGTPPGRRHRPAPGPRPTASR